MDSPKVTQLIEQLRSLQRANVKVADLGGKGNDAEFEEVFSAVAHAYIHDKAPTLEKYEQGFQTIERNEDDTRALGVTGFNVEGMQVYAPVFWLNGDIKGNELLYLADQGMFIPLKESWINELLRKKPITIGEGESRKHRYSSKNPDLRKLVDIPTKYSSYIKSGKCPDWLVSYVVKLGEALHVTDEGDIRIKEAALTRSLRRSTDLRELIKHATYEALHAFDAFIEKYPVIKGAVARSYEDPNFIKTAMREACVRENSILKVAERQRNNRDLLAIADEILQKPAAASVRIITYSMTMGGDVPFSTQADKEKLMRDGYMVQDNRPSNSLSVIVKDYADSKTFNPTESGFYDVLIGPGNYRKMLILKADGHVPERRFLVMDPHSHSAKWLWPNEVWCKFRYPNLDFKYWLDDLPNVGKSIPTDEDYDDACLPRGPSRSSFVILDGDNGECYGPYDGGSCISRTDHISTYQAYPVDPVFHSASPSGFQRFKYENDYKFCEKSEPVQWQSGHPNDCRNNKITVYTGRPEGTNISFNFETRSLYVPLDAKKLKVSICGCDKRPEQNPSMEVGFKTAKLDYGKFSPGQERIIQDTGLRVVDYNDINSDYSSFTVADPKELEKEAVLNTEEVKVSMYDEGSNCSINNQPIVARLDGLKQLMVDYALSEKDANHIFDTARGDIYKTARVRIKRAAMMGGNVEDSATPPPFPEIIQQDGRFMGWSGDTAPSQTRLSWSPTEDMRSTNSTNYMSDDEGYPAMPETATADTVHDAINNGQQDVFDVSMIKALVTNINAEEYIQEISKKLSKGLNDCGELLFKYYWNGEDFEEIYGPQELKELEGSIRKTFESLGDIIIFLKRKTNLTSSFRGIGALSLQGQDM